MQNNESFNRALCACVHTVEAGDTLYMISKMYGVDYRRLMMLNNISNPHNVQIGQQICIPPSVGGGRPHVNTDLPETPGSKPPADTSVHIIQTGDTLYGISKKYGIRLSELMNANPEIDPYNLHTGMKLTIPAPDSDRYYAERRAVMPESITDNSHAPSNEFSISDVSGNSRNSDISDISDVSGNSRNSDISDIADNTVNSNTSINSIISDNANKSDIPNISNISDISDNPGSPDSPDEPAYAAIPPASGVRPYVSDSSADGIIYPASDDENLTSILAKFGICYAALQNENPDTNLSGSLSGITLCIPYEDRFRRCPQNQSYIIKNGDTLTKISEKTGTGTDELLRMNPSCNTLDFSVTGSRIRVE